LPRWGWCVALNDDASVVRLLTERAHRNKLSRKFRSHLKNKRVICLDIPDQFEYMDPALILLLEKKAGPFFK